MKNLDKKEVTLSEFEWKNFKKTLVLILAFLIALALLTAITVLTSPAHAQTKLPKQLFIPITDKQFTHLDSCMSAVQNRLLQSTLPSNEVQYLLALLGSGLEPVYKQVGLQVVADTGKKGRKP